MKKCMKMVKRVKNNWELVSEELYDISASVERLQVLIEVSFSGMIYILTHSLCGKAYANEIAARKKSFNSLKRLCLEQCGDIKADIASIQAIMN